MGRFIPVHFLVYVLKQNLSGDPIFIFQAFLGARKKKALQDDFTARLIVYFDVFINNNNKKKKRCFTSWTNPTLKP